MFFCEGVCSVASGVFGMRIWQACALIQTLKLLMPSHTGVDVRIYDYLHVTKRSAR